MTADTKSKSNGGGNNAIKGKKGKQRYLPHNKPVKRKGSYPLRPGVQGFFITCDGGRESQASHEAINVIDSFYEELVHGKDSGVKLAELPKKPLNKKIKFSYSESSSSGGDDEEEDEGQIISDTSQNDLASHPNAMNEGPDPHKKDGMHHENQTEEKANGIEADADKHENQPKETEEPPTKKQCIETGALDGDKHENQPKETEETPTKKQCIETGASDGDKHENQPKETEEPPVKKQCIETGASKHVIHEKVEETSIDRLIEAELKELGDKNKRRFVKLDSGCNGVGFIQMRKIDGDPGPKDIVQHIMTSAASTKKHMSRFILRMLPIEVACYTSEEEISRAIKPLVAQYFPVETQNPQKFAVLFEARANSGIDRMKIINAVAKSVPGPHKVDLNNPDKTIVVEIIKTVCLIGVVEQYKGLAKYNLRQLTSPKP